MNIILLHTCCACCASYVVPHLQKKFRVINYFYNPNIQPAAEYFLRLDEMRIVSDHFETGLEIPEYHPEEWENTVEPFRDLPEKSRRCWECYRLRLEETARKAAELGIRSFATTLSVSPHKVYSRIVEAGETAERLHGVNFYAEDFKKQNGFKISVRRSRELDLTRQDYCGCILSLREAEERRKRK